jgi:hypothetical protein
MNLFKMTYRIAHAMTQMNAGIPEANSSEGSSKSKSFV